MKNPGDVLLTRYTHNPILTAAQWPYPVNSVFNAGAVRLPDGVTLLLCRVEDRRGHSHLCAARSGNGIDGWEIDSRPTLCPDPEHYSEEVWGIEDPRITYLDELQIYAVVYTAYSQTGPGISLALTEDFQHFERYGLIMVPENKDAALLPYRINGNWALIHRPLSSLSGHMWISSSLNLRHWGDHRVIMRARKGGWWDSHKIGLAAPPVETARGWLVFYHGVRQNAAGSMYRVGVALFDLQRPEICIQRSDEWLLGPEEAYERSGDVDNVVFPCGVTIDSDGDTIRLYYGAADTSIALATGSKAAILEWLVCHSENM